MKCIICGSTDVEPYADDRRAPWWEVGDVRCEACEDAWRRRANP